MQDPSVQRMMQDAANWISERYKNSSNPKEDQQAALEASQCLADITADLPPEYAARVVKQSLPTIQKIAGVDANYSGSQAFTNLSKVVDSLGDGADAQAITNQIAQAHQQPAAFVKAHSPMLVGPDADTRRQADSAYEYSDRTSEGVAGLLANNHNPVYQAEIFG
jgi:hypothetical protein